MDKREIFFDIMDNRKTNRKYSNYIPPKEDIERIINSARLSPSAVNAQNWKFLAVYSQDIKHKMASAVLKMYDEIITKLNDDEIAQNIERYRSHSTFFEQAPVVIVCVMTKSPSFLSGVLEKANYTKEEISLMRPDSQLLSVGGAVQSMALSAHALGLGSCWMVAPIIANKEFKQILNLDDDDKIVSLLTIGKPEDVNGRAHKKELGEIMEIIE